MNNFSSEIDLTEKGWQCVQVGFNLGAIGKIGSPRSCLVRFEAEQAKIQIFNIDLASLFYLSVREVFQQADKEVRVPKTNIAVRAINVIELCGE